MRIETEIVGAKSVAIKLREMADRVGNQKVAFSRMLLYMLGIEAKVFSSQGRRGGGSWAQLTEARLEAKLAKHQDLRILHGRNTLLRSLTEIGAPGQVFKVNRLSMVFGTTVTGAEVHQEGDRFVNIPARPFLEVTKADRSHMRSIVRNHIMGSWGK